MPRLKLMASSLKRSSPGQTLCGTLCLAQNLACSRCLLSKRPSAARQHVWVSHRPCCSPVPWVMWPSRSPPLQRELWRGRTPTGAVSSEGPWVQRWRTAVPMRPRLRVSSLVQALPGWVFSAEGAGCLFPCARWCQHDPSYTGLPNICLRDVTEHVGPDFKAHGGDPKGDATQTQALLSPHPLGACLGRWGRW